MRDPHDWQRSSTPKPEFAETLNIQNLGVRDTVFRRSMSSKEQAVGTWSRSLQQLSFALLATCEQCRPTSWTICLLLGMLHERTMQKFQRMTSGRQWIRIYSDPSEGLLVVVVNQELLRKFSCSCRVPQRLQKSVRSSPKSKRRTLELGTRI